MEFIYKQTKINYFKQGNGDELVVFLHGWGAGSELFTPIAPYFNIDKYTLLFIDFPPFGKSSIPNETWTMQDYFALTKQIIKSQQEEKSYITLNIISHSFGSRVAILLASSREISVDKLVLIGAAGIKPKRRLNYHFKVLKYKILKKISPEKASKMGSNDYKQLPEVMKSTFLKIVNTDLSASSKLVDCNTLIIYGKNDQETPIYMAKKLHKNIKNSQLVIIENAGHFVYLEQPTIVQKYVSLFLNSWQNLFSN